MCRVWENIILCPSSLSDNEEEEEEEEQRYSPGEIYAFSNDGAAAFDVVADEHVLYEAPTGSSRRLESIEMTELSAHHSAVIGGNAATSAN